MAIVIEITDANGAVRELPVGGDSTAVTALPGQSYRLVSDSPSELASARIQRIGEDLIITDLPGEQTLTLEAFFQYIGDQQSPVLELSPFGGAEGETLSQSSEPIAAIADGGFLLWRGPDADERQPVAPEAEFNWRPFAAIGAGLVVAASAGGGGGGDDPVVVGSDRTPDTPIINTQQVTSTTPEITGTGTPDSTVTILIDLGGTGVTVSFRTTVDENGNWSIDTATANPVSGVMPDQGLPLDAPSPIRAVANSSGGNSGLATGSLEIDLTAPTVTATLDRIESDAAAPVGETDQQIRPGNLESGDSTNDTSPTLTGTISAPLEPEDFVVIARNGAVVGQAQVTGLNWSFTDANVPAGQHNYVAQVSDPAGNLTPASTSIAIAIDGTAPQAPTIDPVAGDDVVTLTEAQAGVVVSGSAEPGTTVTIQWGAATQTSSVNENGVYTTRFGASSLPGDGRTPISVSATDSFGNVSESASRPVNIAAGLPAAPIIDTDSALLSGDVAAINAREAAGGFSITGSAEPGTPIQVTFTPVGGGQAIEAGSTVGANGQFNVQFANGSVPDGQYEVNASVTDFAGQTVQGPVVSILVDTVAPTLSATVTGAIDDLPSVTGVLPSGATTNDDTPTITGSLSGDLASNESVLVLRDGQAVGTAQVNARQWQFEESALTQGQYEWSAVVVDSAGNTGPAGANSLTLTLDLTAPASPTINAITGDDVVTAAEAAGGVQVTGTGPAGGQLQLDWAGQTSTVNVNAQGSWSAVFANPPADGRTQITATAIDAAGNRAEAFRTVTVNTQPPETPTISTVAGNDVINSAEAAQGVTVAGTGEAGTRINVSWGNLTETTTVSSAGFWSVNFSDPPADGRSTITANAVDVGGNRSADATRPVTVDTAAPQQPQIQVIEGDDIISAAEAADGIAVQGSAQAGTTVTVRWGGETATTQVGANGLFQVVFNTVAAQGNSSIEVTSTDAAGNTSAVGSRAVVVNTALPPSAPELNALASGNLINAAEASNGITINGTGQAGSDIRVSWGGVVQTTTTGANGTWSVDYAANQIPDDGPSTIVASASSAGGTSQAASLAVSVDTTAPPAPIIQPVAGDNIISASESQNGVQVSGTAQAGSEVTVRWEGVTETAQTNSAGVWQVAFATVPGNGASTITATAADSAGNSSTAGSVDVTVNTVTPTTAPTVLPVAADNTINAAEAAQGPRFAGTSEPGADISVNWEGATQTTTASSSGAWAVLFTQAQIPQDGDTSITVTAQNASGASASTTHDFLLDTISPATPVMAPVTGDDIISAVEAAGPIVISGTAEAETVVRVNWGNATATADTTPDGQWSLTFASIPVGAGQSTIEWIAGDYFGNRSEFATRDVEVITTQAPLVPTIATIATDGIVNAAEAAAGVTVSGAATPGAQINLTWGAHTATTTVATNGSWSIPVASANIPADGNADVSVTASNAGGISAAASATVTVDTDIPAAPVVTAVAGNDVITPPEQNNPILVTGTAAPNSEITVLWGDLTEVVNTTAGGAWQASFAALPSGAETELSVSAADAAGNVSSATTHAFAIRPSAITPTTPVIQAVGGNDDIVNAAEAGVAVPVSGTADAGAQVTVQWGNASVAAVTNTAGDWTAQFTPAQVPADGVAPLTATASVNGVDSAPATRAVKVDTEAPDQLVSIADLIDNSGAITISIADGDTTTDLTPEIVIDLDSALDPTDTIVLTMDGDTLSTLSADDDLTFELGPLVEGSHTFELQVFDEAQNPGVVSDPLTALFDQTQNINSAP